MERFEIYANNEEKSAKNNDEEDLIEIAETEMPGAKEEPELPPVIVWDYDLKRDGETGGFFMASDNPLVEQRYTILDAPTGPGWNERVIKATQKIPGRYLPDPAHFVVLKCGKLQNVTEPSEFSPQGMVNRYRLRALVAVREVRDSFEDDQYALVRLSVRGIAAIKLVNYFNQLTRVAQRISALLTKQTGRLLRISTQKIWVPVSVARAVPLGRNGQQVGALPDVDQIDPKTGRYRSRWELIEDKFLTATYSAGGYILDRADLNRIAELAARAEEFSSYVCLGETAKQNGEMAETNAQNSEIGIPTTEELLNALADVGLTQTDPRVVRRLEEFGATSLNQLNPTQRLQFAALIEDFRTRMVKHKVA